MRSYSSDKMPNPDIALLFRFPEAVLELQEKLQGRDSVLQDRGERVYFTRQRHAHVLAVCLSVSGNKLLA